jgi:hypothetical protein
MTSAREIEEALRQRYRQPAGVEQFGIEPVPVNRRTVGWFDLLSIMFNFLINPGSLLSGGLAVAAGLPFAAAVLAQVVGTAVALAFYLVMATIGVDYGIPGQVATRAVYGWRGAKAIPSLLRTVASVYWFAFQTLAGASAILAMLPKLTGMTFPLVGISVIFGLLQAGVASATARSRFCRASHCRSRSWPWPICLRCSLCMTIRTSALPRFCLTRGRAVGTGCLSPAGLTSRWLAGSP